MDDSAEWLKPKDLALAVAILEAFPESRRTAVEIGVWKGAWSLGVLENVAGSAVLGVDPYPGISGHKIRSILEERVSVTRVGKRFNLVSGLAMATSCLAGAKPVLVHIDGEHTEAGVGADLSWARQALAPDGIIVVDDYIHSWFPGIASAMHAFLRAEDFRIVLVTESKAYLCHASRHAEWYSRLNICFMVNRRSCGSTTSAKAARRDTSKYRTCSDLECCWFSGKQMCSPTSITQ